MEYVLLLIVILTLAYAFAKQLFPTLKNYGTSVFSNSLACSLEYGKLQAAIQSEEGCDNQGGGGTNGGTNSLSGGSGGSGQGKDGKSGGAGKKEAAARAKNDPGSGDNQAANSGGGSSGETARSGLPGGGGSTTIHSSKGTLQLGPAKGVESRARPSEQIVTPFSESSADYGSSYSRSGFRRRRPIYKAVSGEIVLAKADKKPIEREISRSAASVSGLGSGDAGRPKKLFLSAEVTKKKGEEKKVETDFSAMIRIALIVILILGIIIFVFFQVAQVRKGSQS